MSYQELPLCCRWSEAIESVLTTNLRVMFAWQRTWLRAWGVR